MASGRVVANLPTTSTRSPLTNLPAEMILEISNHLSGFDEELIHYTNCDGKGELSRLSRVSRKMRDIIQPRLFRAVTFHREGKSALFGVARLLDTLRQRPNLTGMVRYLSIESERTLEAPRFGSEDVLGIEVVNRAIEKLGLTPGVVRRALGIYRGPRDGLWKVRQDDRSHRCIFKLLVQFLLFEVGTGLERLRIATRWAPESLPEHRQPRELQLPRLKYFTNRMHAMRPLDAWDWYGDWQPVDINPMEELRLAAPALQELSVSNLSPGYNFDNLRKLKIVLSRRGFDAEALAGMLQQCRTLEDLSLKWDVKSIIADVLPANLEALCLALQAGAGTLRKLGLQLGTDVRSDPSVFAIPFRAAMTLLLHQRLESLEMDSGMFEAFSASNSRGANNAGPDPINPGASNLDANQIPLSRFLPKSIKHVTYRVDLPADGISVDSRLAWVAKLRREASQGKLPNLRTIHIVQKEPVYQGIRPTRFIIAAARMFRVHQLASLAREDWYRRRKERETANSEAEGRDLTVSELELKVELTWVVEFGETIEYEIGVPEPFMTDDCFATMTKKAWKLFREGFTTSMRGIHADCSAVIGEVLDALNDLDDDEPTFRPRFRDLFVALKMATSLW